MNSEELEALAQRFQLAPAEFNTSPLYQALAPVVAEDRGLLELIAQRRPGVQPTNLFFAAVHYLVLSTPDSPLAAYYPSVVGDRALPPGQAIAAFGEFCDSQRDALAEILKTRLVQTNPLGRSAALRWALSAIADDSISAVHLVEVGTSAGLHLLHDRYRYVLEGREFGDLDSPVEIRPEWRGTSGPPDLDEVPGITTRLGVDLHTVRTDSPEDRRWLVALVWPENFGEVAQLEAALEVVAANPPDMIEGDFIDVAEAVHDRLPEGETRVVFHAATRAHVPRDRRGLFADAVQSLGRSGPLYVVTLEGPTRGDPQPPGVPCHLLKVQPPTGPVRNLAWVEGHGDWILPIED